MSPIIEDESKYYIPTRLDIDPVSTLIDSADNENYPSIREKKSPFSFNRIELAVDETNKRYLSSVGILDDDKFGQWKMRIGLHTFHLPPISVSISEINSNVQTAYLLRSKTSSKKDPGKRLRQITMSFIFPNISKGDVRLWGSLSNGSFLRGTRTYDKVVPIYSDNFVGPRLTQEIVNSNIENEEFSVPAFDQLIYDSKSFRGFIAMFQNSPFLPVYNTYLNDIFGIEAVALVSMNAKTVPGMPNCLQVEVVMYEFNWKAYVPNVGHFEEIFIKEKFADYFIRSVKKLHEYVGVPFDAKSLNYSEYGFRDVEVEENIRQEQLDKIEDRYDNFLKQNYGRLFEPSTTSMNDIEIFWSDHRYNKYDWLSKLLGNHQQGLITDQPPAQSFYQLLNNTAFNYLFDSFMGVEAESVQKTLLSFVNEYIGTDQQDSVEAYEMLNSLVSLTKIYINSHNTVGEGQYLQYQINEQIRIAKQTGYLKTYDDEMIELWATRLVLKTNYETSTQNSWIENIINSPAVILAMTNDNLNFKGEWELPMKRMGLMNYDLKKSIILEGISVTTQNAITMIPLTGKTMPTLQYIGGLGSKFVLQFKIIGEAALQLFSNTMDNISGSALSNKNNVVSSVVGIQNELINLFGIKYCLIDSWQVDTIPNYPHTYNLTIALSDFDILQQKRETPYTQSGNASEAESKRILNLELKAMTNSNSPFTRMRQLIPEYNAYPDLPLPKYKYNITGHKWGLDDSGNLTIEGTTQYKRERYFDPDYYFRRIEYYEMVQDENGNVDLNAFDNTTFDSLGIQKTNISNVEKVAWVGGNEIGSTEPIGTSPSMQPILITEFNPLVSNGGGYYNVSLELINKKMFNDVVKEEDKENDEIHASAYSYLNDRFKNSLANEFLNRQNTSSKKNTKMATYPVVQAGQQTGYINGSPAGTTNNFGTGFIQATPHVITDEDNEFDYRRKIADINMYNQDEREAFNQIILDAKYRNFSGRMIQAFPNYVIYIIDEGGQMMGYRLFDTFYGMQSAVSIDVLTDKDAPMDTAVVQFSNLSSRLSTSPWYNNMSLPDFVKKWYTSIMANMSRMYGIVTDNKGFFEVTPGMRLQVRMGYSANADNLPTVFNGTISSAELGNICTIIAAGDGAELNFVSEQNAKGDAVSLSLFGMPMADPTSIILQLLAANGSKWQEITQRGMAGMNPGTTGESTNHFGSILWDTTAFGGDAAWIAMQNSFVSGISSRAKNLANEMFEEPKPSDNVGNGADVAVQTFTMAGLGTDFFETAKEMAGDITAQYANNLISLKRDYEIYKRNIFPSSNGGYRDFENQADKVMQSPGTGWHGLVAQAMGKESYIDTNLVDWFSADDCKRIEASIIAGKISVGLIVVGVIMLVGTLVSGGLALLGVGGVAATGTAATGAAATASTAAAAETASAGIVAKALAFAGSRAAAGWVIRTGLAVGALGFGMAAQAYTDGHKRFNVRKIKLNTGGKTNWQIMTDAASAMPNYVLGVRPFEQRSTLFFGKQFNYYTSGVIPVFEPEEAAALSKNFSRTQILQQASPAVHITEQGARNNWILEDSWFDNYVGSGTGIWYLPGEDNWFYTWMSDPKTIAEIAKRFKAKWSSGDVYAFTVDQSIKDSLIKKGDYYFLADFMDLPEGYSVANKIAAGVQDNHFKPRGSWQEFLSWIKGSEILNDYCVARGSVEAEMYKIKFKSKGVDTRINFTDYFGTWSNIIGDDDYYTHHLCYRYDVKASTLYPPKTNAVHSTDTGYFKSRNTKIEYIDENSGFINFLLGLYECWLTAIETEDGLLNINDQLIDWFLGHLDPETGSMEMLWNIANKDEDTARGTGYGNIPPIRIQNNKNAKTSTKDSEEIEYGENSVQNILYKDVYKKLKETRNIYEISVGAETNEGEFIDTDDKLENEITESSNKVSANQLKEAFGVYTAMLFGGPDLLLNSTAVGSVTSNLGWECLQDSIYYGHTGTKEDPHKYDFYHKAKEVAIIEGLESLSIGNTSPSIKKPEMTDEDWMIRSMQILSDNPFSKEYGEPVFEVREPFVRFHYAYSFSNIVSNTIKANNQSVLNKITAVAHTTGKSNGKRQQTVMADVSIPGQYVREGVVDTGLNYELLSFTDEVMHKNMARYHLKKSLQNMYDGELVVLGNPYIRPFDFLYIFDEPNAMHGNCEVNRVIHSFSIENGYTTSLVVAPIISVDDAAEFGWTTTNWFMEERKAIRELAAQNIITGQVTRDNVDASYSDTMMREINQKTLGVLDTIVHPSTVAGGVTMTTQSLLQNAMALASEATAELQQEFEANKENFMKEYSDKIKSEYGDAAKAYNDYLEKRWDDDHYNNDGGFGGWIRNRGTNIADAFNGTGGFGEYAIGEDADYIKKGKGNTGGYWVVDSNSVPIYFDDDVVTREEDLLNAAMYSLWLREEANEDGSIGPKEVEEIMQDYRSVQVVSKLISLISMGANSTSFWDVLGNSAKLSMPIAMFSVPVGAKFGGGWGAALGGLAAIFGSIWGAKKMREYAVRFAESEPISVILLNKDGKPLEAGLKGADGCIVGKSMHLGWISDYIALPMPERREESVYGRLGMNLSDVSTIRRNKTYFEQKTAQEIMTNQGQIMFGDKLGAPPFVAEVSVTEVLDGDTIKISPSAIYDREGMYRSFSNSSIRLLGVDAPETVKPDSPGGGEVGGEACKAAMQLYIRQSDNKVKLVFTPFDIQDAYGRGLAIVVGQTSEYYDNLESLVETGQVSLADVFMQSLNMRLINDFLDTGYVNNLFVSAGNENDMYFAVKQLMDGLE